MSSETEFSDEIKAAMGRIGSMFGGGVEAGADPCVMAAACIWTGVKETIELTDPASAAAALRAIAHQIEPLAAEPREKTFARGDGAPGGDANLYARRPESKKAAPGNQQNGFTQNIPGDVVDEVIELLDQGHLAEARALLMALRSRLRDSMVGDFVMGKPRRR
jgi:hypothetical protein